MTTKKAKRQKRSGRNAGAAPPASRRKAPEPPPAADNGSSEPQILKAYRDQVTPSMMQEFKYKNVMQVPRINKIVLNIGLGEAKDNARSLEGAIRDLTTIAGQKPVITRARKAIAGFKIREGMPVGVSVTLRGERMNFFLERLLSTALPRIRDFRGVPKSSFDGRGNYSMGIREQVIFPEIDYNQIDKIRGFQVTIATSAKTDAEAARLLELLGMPFVRQL
jgi:large subunit ribosomal protein L5